MSFSGFSLSSNMVNALTKLGYENPSPVQQVVIPKALRGTSLLAQSETGSGKTHSYLVPIIERLDMNLNRPQAVIITPTRELSRQVFEFAREFQRFFPKLKVRLFTSEADVSQNEEGSTVAPQLIIGTPGRVKQLLVDKELFILNNVKTVVLDEADMLLDLGYFEDIEGLFASLREPQTMVFSATLKQNLKDELLKFVRSDFEFESDKVHTASTVKHHLINIKHIGESNALVQFLKLKNPYLCIVFCSTKDKVNEIHKALLDNNIDALYFSGSLDERSRKRALREIKANTHSIIVASDLLARGMDIPDVTDVVSVDLPNDLEFYHHRAGRTGRFGKSGDSWVFYNNDTEAKPRELYNSGVKFDFYSLRAGKLVDDPVGLAEKTKFRKKAEFSPEEIKEIKIAKAKTKKDKVEPMHKKKTQFAIEKVKRKYKRKAIQRSVRKQLENEAKAKRKARNGGDE